MNTSDLRVCLVCEGWPPAAGRTESRTVALAEALVERGIASLVVAVGALEPSPARPGESAASGEPPAARVEVHRVPAAPGSWRTLGGLVRKLDELRPRYDLLYVAGSRRLAMPILAFARARKKKVVLESEATGELAGVPKRGGAAGVSAQSGAADVPAWGGVAGGLSAARRAALLLADHFVATAPSREAELVAAGVPRERISLIPHGVDLDRFRPAEAGGKERLRERLGLPERAVIFCFSGLLVAWNAPLVLLEAVRQGVEIRSRSQEALKGPQGLVLFLGAGGPHPRSQEAQAHRFRNENGLESRVRFLGDVLNVADYLRAADAIVLPSLAEAFSLALAQGMACGLAPVTTTVCAEGNGLIHGQNALVVPPGDVEALREALIRLMDEPGLRRGLGAAAALTAREFSLEDVADRYAELFRRIAAFAA